jgi:flagellar biosynthetic protein FliP
MTRRMKVLGTVLSLVFVLLILPHAAFAADANSAQALTLDLTGGSGGSVTERLFVIVALSLFLTFFVMSPTFDTIYDTAIKPLNEQQITTDVAFDRAAGPIRTFMAAHTNDSDLTLFLDMGKIARPASQAEIPLKALIPAFMISELKRAFEIGFLIFVPFLVIDMAVSSVLMSMGMMMLPPVVISLPFKLIFFVLADGWHLIAGSLVKSYGM